MDGEFRGTTAWVIGGSGAIGAAIARALAEDGAEVWVSGRNAARVADTVAAITGAAGQVRGLVLEQSDPGAIDAAVGKLLQASGRIDILVNCATSAVMGDFLGLTDADWEEAFQGKLMVYVRAIRAVLPAMLRAGGGTIVNVSGRGGRLPNPDHLAGGSMNAAVNLLTKGLSDVFAARGIRVNAVAPGAIASPRMEQFAEVAKHSGRAPARNEAGEAVDVAEAVLWLASSRSRHVTGTVLAVDGGSLPNL